MAGGDGHSSSRTSTQTNGETGVLSVDDQMRLVGGGNDIFVTVGIVLLFSGALFALQAVLPPNSMLLAVLLAAGSWLVAEIVTRQKRMRLSSTLLALVFSAAVLTLLIDFIGQQFSLPATINAFSVLALREDALPIGLILAGGLVAAAALYFARFKVPVLAAVVAISATGLAFLLAVLIYYEQMISGGIAAPAPDQLAQVVSNALTIPLLCGLAVFAVAVFLDLQDRERQTVWSDCAFWLACGFGPIAGASAVHPGHGTGRAFRPDRTGDGRQHPAWPDDRRVRAGGARHRPPLAACADAGVFRLRRDLLPRQRCGQHDRHSAFCADSADHRRDRDPFRCRLAKDPPLDYPSAASHIAPRETSPDKGMIPT
jgi:hypothetical protein